MIREERFLISHSPYAVDLSSLQVDRLDFPNGNCTWRGRIDAVWFRRKSGKTTAHIGELWDLQSQEPADAIEFLTQHTDGRYGGNCEGRWDGASYWGNVTLQTQEQHLAILRPMLTYYPEIPAGYDGWWCFNG